MTTFVNVFIPATFRIAGIWPVRSTLRPAPPLHTQPGFCPVFERLDAPIDLTFWKRYDYIEAMPLDEAEKLSRLRGGMNGSG
jgi:hypothetical protein